MTMPDERSRAVLWAGGFLVQLNYDRRIPIDVRRTAHHIARHFPTAEEVRTLAHLQMADGTGGMFERPSDVGDWRESCPGQPLTYNTRLAWPDDISDDAEDANETASETDLDLQLVLGVEEVAQSQELHDRRMERVYTLLVKRFPELGKALAEIRWDEATAAKWACTKRFDGQSKSAAELFIEGRGEVVLDAYRRMIHGHF